MNRPLLSVLVVEDHPTIARQLVDFLDGLGWSRIMPAAGLAVQLAAQNRYDVVLLDLNLPDMAIGDEDGRLLIANTLDAAHASQVQGFAHGQDLLARVARSIGWEIAFHRGQARYRVEILPLPAR